MFKKLKHHRHGFEQDLAGDVKATVVGTAASFGFGAAMAKYPEHATKFGVSTELLAGAGFKLASLVCTGLGVASGLRPYLDGVGNAGIFGWAHSKGARWGFEKKGMTPLLAPTSDVKKIQGTSAGTTILGVDEKAPEGVRLTVADLQGLARRR